jgi:cholest-4-en-3-one 26-monooxygenase
VTADEEHPSLLSPDAYFAGCPFDRLVELRQAGPVSWQPATTDTSVVIPEIDGGWFVHGYEELRGVLRNPATFSSGRRSVVLWDPDDELNAAMANMLINMDPPLHRKHRRLVSAVFTPRRVSDLAPRVDAIAAGVVDAIASKGQCDAVADLAAPMPMTVIAELVGVPERAQSLFEISNRMVGALDSEPAERAVEAAAASIEIQTLGQELAREKRSAPDGSLISAYVNGGLDVEGGHDGCTDEEVGWFILLLTAAGNETVRTATAQAIRLLAEHPDQREWFLADLDGRLEQTIDEILRFWAPLRAVRRTATTDTDLGGVQVAADDKVVCHFSAALHDERRFDDPERFDPSRPSPGHQLAFGLGEHYCLGANLARLQLRAILREIYSRIPDIRVVGPVEHQPGVQFEGLLSMPIAFTPELPEALATRDPAD